MRSLNRWAHAGAVILLGLLVARDVYAWGDTGHHIICEIAFQELNPQARARVIQRLQGDPDFSAFSKAFTWPDHPRQRALEHFVNLPRAAWTGTSAKDWAHESFRITTAEAVRYCVKTETGCWYEAGNTVWDAGEAQKVVTVDEDYINAHLPTMTQRLTQAGIRLGHLLNRAIGGE